MPKSDSGVKDDIDDRKWNEGAINAAWVFSLPPVKNERTFAYDDLFPWSQMMGTVLEHDAHCKSVGDVLDDGADMSAVAERAWRSPNAGA